MTIRKTENHDFNRPKMSTRRRATVFVEGPTDKVLWKRFFSRNHCKLERVDGKTIVMSRLRSVEKRHERGFAGIIDADYSLISNDNELETPNLLYDNSFPDLETILVNSEALQTVISNNLLLDDSDKVESFTHILCRESHCLAMEFGYYRWLEHRHNFGLPCNAIIERQTNAIVNLRLRKLNHIEVARLLTQRNNRVTQNQLEKEVNKLRSIQPPSTVQLCRGKDILEFMAHILPSLFKELFHKKLPQKKRTMLKADPIATQLRGAYHESDFKDTSLFGCIQNWESANMPYKILKPEI